MKKIKVLIADDHTILRKGLRLLLSNTEKFELVGEAENGFEAVELTTKLLPDIVLIDLVMPGMNGIEAIREIKLKSPQMPILVLTSFAEEENVFPAIKAGAMGYLLKDSPPEQLLKAIEDVYHGQSFLHPSIAYMVLKEIKHPAHLPPTENPLTEREMEVLKCIARGLSNTDIATKLSISEWTVRTHTRNILDKLHLANRVQAALYALREGIITLSETSKNNE